MWLAQRAGLYRRDVTDGQLGQIQLVVFFGNFMTLLSYSATNVSFASRLTACAWTTHLRSTGQLH